MLSYRPYSLHIHESKRVLTMNRIVTSLYGGGGGGLLKHMRLCCHLVTSRSFYSNAVFLLKEFVINTPDFEATKIWSGNLGKTATHALVYAQLYTPDGACHGLHSFVVPIRDKHNLATLPGILVGDMGEKIGLNGMDNG